MELLRQLKHLPRPKVGHVNEMGSQLPIVHLIIR